MDSEKIKNLEERLSAIESVQNSSFFSKIVDGIVSRKASVIDSKVQITTSIGIGGGTVTHLDFPDEWLIVKYKGKLYRVPMYLESRFV